MTNTPQDVGFNPFMEIGEVVELEHAAEHAVMEPTQEPDFFGPDGKMNQEALAAYLLRSVAPEEQQYIPYVHVWVKNFDDFDAFIRQSGEAGSILPFLHERLHRFDHVAARRAIGFWLESNMGGTERAAIANIVGAIRRRDLRLREGDIRARDFITLLMDYYSHPRDWMQGGINYIIERSDLRAKRADAKVPESDPVRAEASHRDIITVIRLRELCDRAFLSIERALVDYHVALPSLRISNENDRTQIERAIVELETRGGLTPDPSVERTLKNLNAELRRLEGEATILANVDRVLVENLPPRELLAPRSNTDVAAGLLSCPPPPELPAVAEDNIDFLALGAQVQWNGISIDAMDTYGLGDEQFQTTLATARAYGIARRKALRYGERSESEDLADLAEALEHGGEENVLEVLDTFSGDTPVPRSEEFNAHQAIERGGVERYVRMLLDVYYEELCLDTAPLTPTPEDGARIAVSVQRLLQEMGVASQLVECTSNGTPCMLLRVALRDTMPKQLFVDHSELLLDPVPRKSLDGSFEPSIYRDVRLITQRALGIKAKVRFQILAGGKLFLLEGAVELEDGEVVPRVNTVLRKTPPATLLTPTVSRVETNAREEYPDIDWEGEFDQIFDRSVFGIETPVEPLDPVLMVRSGLEDLETVIAGLKARQKMPTSPGFDPNKTMRLSRKDIAWLKDEPADPAAKKGPITAPIPAMPAEPAKDEENEPEIGDDTDAGSRTWPGGNRPL